jgi:glycosyltransferase involved in cell wall biosynthesis
MTRQDTDGRLRAVSLIGVVIPAHNEERTIGRLLAALENLRGEAEVVVVCNGCTDTTSAVVTEKAPWVKVVELAEGSKPAALRIGDRTVTAIPRLYLDADVILTAAAVRRLAAALADGNLLAVAPTPHYDVDGANLVVRSHYRIWTALYTSIDAVYGTGAIMVSEAGRARFGDWPDVIADDYFIDGLFAADEKRRLPNVEVTVALPRRFVDCVSRKARVHQGKRDILREGLRQTGVPGGQRPSLLGLLRDQPSLTVDVPAHVLVTLSGRTLSAWRRWRGTAQTFHRDLTTR